MGGGAEQMSKYIDTDTAYKVLTEYYHQKTQVQHEALKEALSRVPAADVVEVRHGRWIYRQLPMPLSDGSKECVECSVCHTHWDGKMNYCPNCGSHMDLDEVEE